MIREATINDLDEISLIESICFPEAEACKKETFLKRLTKYSNHFMILEENNKIISFINGFTTDDNILTDEMYDNETLHNESGKNQMIFGVNTLPDYQNKGYASKLMKEFIKKAKQENRESIILTCKKELIPFYERFQFKNEGLSNSTHGDTTWYQMRLELK